MLRRLPSNDQRPIGLRDFLLHSVLRDRWDFFKKGWAMNRRNFLAQVTHEAALGAVPMTMSYKLLHVEMGEDYITSLVTWVPVGIVLPKGDEVGRLKLAATKDGVYLALYVNEKWYNQTLEILPGGASILRELKDVTHWASLPDNPNT